MLAPPRNVVTSLECRGSPTRSRGTCRRWVSPVTGSVMRRETMPSRGSAKSARSRCSVPGSGSQPSSSRNSTSSADVARTPALRPAGIPTLSGRLNDPGPGRRRRQIDTIGDHDDLGRIPLLGNDTRDRTLQLGRPVPHREDDAGDVRRHCSRREARMLARCSTTIVAAMASMAPARTCDP